MPAPMVPAAPGRLSTTTGWPSSSLNPGTRVRAMMSVAPPGARPTMRRTGFDGYEEDEGCPSAQGERSGETRAASNANARNMRDVYLIRMGHGAKRLQDFRF